MPPPAESPAFRRIDPAAIPAAFLRHGLEPGRHAFRNGCKACVLGVMLAEAGVELPPGDVDLEAAAAALGLPRMYAAGLANGWDGGDYPPREKDGPEYAAGFEDGRAAAAQFGLPCVRLLKTPRES